jgi:hypothetical protein
MTDPYRDELLALRVENERLRRRIAAHERPRGARAAIVGAAVGGSSVAGLLALMPLLNAPSDGRFFAGIGGVIALVALDVVLLVRLARWATPARAEDDPP